MNLYLILFFYKTIWHLSENSLLTACICSIESAAISGSKSCLWITVISSKILRVGSVGIEPVSYCGTLLTTHRSNSENSESHPYAEAGGEGGREGRSAGS